MPESIKKTALITGASSGLGAEFANQLAARSYDLILTARREDRLRQVAETLQDKYKVEVSVLPADLSKYSDLDRVISVINSTSNLDILVNNAGFGLWHRFLRADPEMEQAQLQVLMIAPVMLCRSAVPAMVSRNQGAVINVSSMAGIVPIRSVLYGSSKSFLIHFSEALQAELHGTPIRIQALCPGFIYTEFHDTPEYTRFRRESIPMFLWLTPEKVVSDSLNSLDDHNVICIPGTLYGIIGALARNSITAGLIKLVARFFLNHRKR